MIIIIYGPNNEDPSFFHNFFSILNNLPSSDLIRGGDHNTTLDPTIDKQNTTGNNTTHQSTAILKQYMEDCGLGNSWEAKSPH